MGMGLSRTWLTQAADSPLSRHPSAVCFFKKKFNLYFDFISFLPLKIFSFFFFPVSFFPIFHFLMEKPPFVIFDLFDVF